ncbi:MAG: hypothetical protein M3Q29_11490 [Chloroflexota bacterium]|nr:hypothetical protein [Chloroflexota bacterium]
MSKDENETVAEAGPDRDVLLQWLMGFAEAGLEYTITLSVGGLLVSGILVAQNTYLEAFANQFTDALQGALSPTTVDEMKQIFHPLYQDDEESETEAGHLHSTSALRRPYIHLRDARICIPDSGPIPTSTGTLWRGKVSAVDAFFLGALGWET